MFYACAHVFVYGSFLCLFVVVVNRRFFLGYKFQQFGKASWLASSKEPPVSFQSVLGLEAGITTPTCFKSTGDLNSSSHAFLANSLKLSHLPSTKLILINTYLLISKVN